MTSYFDEHNYNELGNAEESNHLLNLARLLIDSGIGTYNNMYYFNRFLLNCV